MDDGRILVGLLAVALAVPVVAGSFLSGSGARGSSAREVTELVLRFPRGTIPAVAKAGALVATGTTADEALARLGYLAFCVARERGLDPDEARTEAWTMIEPLVDRHRDELDDQGDAVSAMLDRMVF